MPKTFSIEIRGVHLESNVILQRDCTSFLIALQSCLRIDVTKSLISDAGLDASQIILYPSREAAEPDLCYALRRALPGLKDIPDVFPDPNVCMLDTEELFAIAGAMIGTLVEDKPQATATDVWGLSDELLAHTLELPQSTLAEWRQLGAVAFAEKVKEADLALGDVSLEADLGLTPQFAVAE